VLICAERKVLLAGCWWLVCSEKSTAGWWLISQANRLWVTTGLCAVLGHWAEKYHLHSSEDEESKNLVPKRDVTCFGPFSSKQPSLSWSPSYACVQVHLYGLIRFHRVDSDRN
jgi:hypothetical protein